MKKSIYLIFLFLFLFSFNCFGDQVGISSFYYKPQKTANGKWFTPDKMWAAHKTLPFGTKIKVTNVNNGKSVIVTINDRGPYIKGRVLDLSKSAFAKIAAIKKGLCKVKIERLK